MEVILTDEEKRAATWLELDDASVGRLVKAEAMKIKEIAGEQDKIVHFAAGIILCTAAIESNADVLKNDFTNLIFKGKPTGNWRVTVKKI